jgi:tetratricopeptide (TPR) repeat protein
LQVAGVCALLVLAVWGVFGQTAGFGFVNYDDNLYVYENPIVQKGLTWQGARWAATYKGIGHWHPLTWLSHMADCQVFGLWAGGHHLTNVALHAVAAVLLFLVLRSMTGALWRSAFVAALFAIHPLRAESVAWIAERKDVLSGVFFMLTLWAYVRYARQPSGLRYAAVTILFGLGLLCKNMLVTLPFVLLLLDYWPLARFHNPRQFLSLAWEKIPLLLLSAASCVGTVYASEKISALDRKPFAECVANALVSCVIYLRQMVFPAGLAIPYPFAQNGTPIWKVGAAVAVLAGVTAGAVACRKKRPFLLMGWLWYLGMLVPVIGIVQISYYAHADRYTYLPGIGLAIAATWAVADWSAKWRRQRMELGALMLAVVGALAVCAHVQTSYWRDGESLWTHTLACTTGNLLARVLLGQFRMDEVIAQYRKVLEIAPDDVKTLNNLGNALAKRGADDEALAQFQKALKIQPNFADTHLNLGNHFLHSNPAQAIAEYRKALELSPNNPDILNNLGKALASTGADDAAIAEYRKALELQPNDANLHYNLGNRLLKQGKLDEAAAHFRKAVEINPNDAGARNNLGRALLLKEDAEGAMACFEKTTAMSPDPLARWDSLGQGFLQQQHPAEAIMCFRQADQLSGGRNPVILRALAAAYAAEGSYGPATDAARRALNLAVAQKMDALAATLHKEIKLYATNTAPQLKSTHF